MKELAVVSGKGGTGKTTVSASLIALAGNAVASDCDDDAADLHLVLHPTIQQRIDFWAGHVAVIRPEVCGRHGVCAASCRFDAVIVGSNGDGERSYMVDPHLCEGCGVCVRFCPNQAITFPERHCGEWFISETRYGPMVHARLGIAAENSGKLVTLVRREAKRIAEEKNLATIIIDASAGIGCPVIASLSNVSFALVVAEPTLSGLHDFRRILKLVRGLRVPSAVCINKHDIHPGLSREIEQLSREEDLPIVGRLPYDPDVTKAQVARQTAVEFSDGDAAREIRRMWDRLREVV
jgi:MinD superfamily P-loop ATPase